MIFFICIDLLDLKSKNRPLSAFSKNTQDVGLDKNFIHVEAIP